MQIDKKLIENVARLARLELSEDEKEGFVKDFREILSAFSLLDEVDVKKTEASFQPVELGEYTREDVVGKSLSQEEALSQTSLTSKGYFKGPRAV
jgi:aspartyl-tRNA(Asn)/glutamyl-tRNA(Gln) amidotransferase subunit C